MSFMFGDLSAAPLTTNFLEELRDAIDFTTAVAEADQLIATAEATREGLRRHADEEDATLSALVGSMLAAADAVEKGAADGIAARLASDLGQVIQERRDAAGAAVQSKLADALRGFEAATLAARQDYFPTLEEYLLAREPPDAKKTIRLELVGAGKKDRNPYVAESIGRSDFGLDWTIEMAVPDDGIWSGAARVGQVTDELSILAPRHSGLLKKDVKLKKQRLDRHFLTSIVDDGSAVRVELREDVGGQEGFVVEADLDRGSLSLAKVGEEGNPAVGPFEVAAAEDEPALLDLASKLRAMLRELPKKRLAAATFEGLPFDGTSSEAQPKLVEIVPRLIAKLAPLALEIGARSRSGDELVLRRTLADGHREELFLPKARLRERLAMLDPAHKGLFAAVASAFDATPLETVPPVDVAAPAPSVRHEVPPSSPGPVRRRSGNMAAVVPETPPPAGVKQTLLLAVEAQRPTVQTEPGLADVEPSSQGASLVATLDQIRALAKEGQLEEAFRGYSALFATSAFASCGPETQREALRLMIFGDVSPSPGDAMRAAHRAALPFVQALVLEQRDAADYEMLGMTYLALTEPEKATEMFKKALDIERTRNPASELCGSLMRRVSEP